MVSKSPNSSSEPVDVSVEPHSVESAKNPDVAYRVRVKNGGPAANEIKAAIEGCVDFAPSRGKRLLLGVGLGALIVGLIWFLSGDSSGQTERVSSVGSEEGATGLSH